MATPDDQDFTECVFVSVSVQVVCIYMEITLLGGICE